MYGILKSSEEIRFKIRDLFLHHIMMERVLSAEQERLLNEELDQLNLSSSPVHEIKRRHSLKMQHRPIDRWMKQSPRSLNQVSSCLELPRTSTSRSGYRVRNFSAGATRKSYRNNAKSVPTVDGRPSSRHNSFSGLELNFEEDFDTISRKRNESCTNRAQQRHNPVDDGFAQLNDQDDDGVLPFRIEITTDGKWMTPNREIKSATAGIKDYAIPPRSSVSCTDVDMKAKRIVQWPHQTLTTTSDGIFTQTQVDIEQDRFETVDLDDQSNLNWCGNSPVTFESHHDMISPPCVNAQDLDVDDFTNLEFTTSLDHDFLSLFAPNATSDTY